MFAPGWLDRSPWPWVALFVVAFLPLAHDAAIEKFYSADGAGYFQWLLERGGFTDFAWARNHSVYVVQWPLVLALRAGVTDWTVLETLFALGLLLPFAVGFALCVAARRGLSQWPLLFPIASLLAITIPADYLLVGEHHVLVAVAWPLLFLALRPARLTGWEMGMAALLALIMTRTYESAVVVAPVLAGACLLRTRQASEQRTALRLLAGLCLVGAAMAAVSILVPRDPGNRSAFLQSLLAPARRSQVLFGAVFLVPFLLALWRPSGRRSSLTISVAAIVVLLMVGLSGVAPGWPGASTPVWAGDSFASRTLSMTLLPPLLVVAGAFLLHERRVVFTRASFAAFVVFTTVVVAVSLHENRQWVDFREAFKATLASRTGVVPIESTPLANHPAGWPWNNAILSYLWSDGPVRAVVLNRPDIGWEPFDPRTTPILEAYRQPPDFLTRR